MSGCFVLYSNINIFKSIFFLRNNLMQMVELTSTIMLKKSIRILLQIVLYISDILKVVPVNFFNPEYVRDYLIVGTKYFQRIQNLHTQKKNALMRQLINFLFE